MAKVKSISTSQINSLSGVIDFYYWKGIPVARKWPNRNQVHPSAAEVASRYAFTQSRADLKLVSPAVRLAWREISGGVSQAWLDYYTGIYMRIWRDYKRLPPVLTNFSVSVEEI